MTSYEAQQQVEACERHIAGSHAALCNAAWAVGTSAFQAASNKVVLMTVIPLCFVVIGIIMTAIGSGWGVALIIAGLIGAYKLHQSGAEVRRAVQAGQNVLNGTINNNTNI